MIRLLIVDDHEMIRKGLQRLLETERDIDVVGLVGSGKEAVAACAKGGIDIVLMDLTMPGMGGLAAIGAIKRSGKPTTVLAVTINDDRRNVREAVRAGALGYILKHSSKEQILAAIRDVAAGRSHFTTGLMMALSGNMDTMADNFGITPKEAEVLKLIAEELSNQEMADRLHCSLRTIDTHKRNISRKLGVKGPVGLIKHAIDRYKS